jgi:hypothetical protein
VSFPSAIFRRHNRTSCQLSVDASAYFPGCGVTPDLTISWSDETLSWGYPLGPEIFEYWPQVDPDPVNVGEFVDFSVVAADLNGYPLTYSWRLNGEEVGQAADYRFQAECYHPGAMSLELELTSNGGTLTRHWLVRVADDSRIPPDAPFLNVDGGVSEVPSLGSVILRAGTGGASEYSWSATCGSVVGAGPVVTYYAPAIYTDPVECTVSVSAGNSCGESAPTPVILTITPGVAGFTEYSGGLSDRKDVAAWGDYDNDGDLDIVQAGDPVRLYRNDGGAFSEILGALPAYGAEDLVWGDYDNDGDLDLVLVGYDLNAVIRNDAGTFVDIGAGSLGHCDDGPSVAWGDFDNDGDLDILIAGIYEAGAKTRVYWNYGGDTFADAGATLPGTQMAEVACSDHDGDGDLDILLAGWSSPQNICRIYRNDGGGNFVDIEAGLPGLNGGAAAWGDYDNDGDPDVVLAGGGDITRVYRNDAGTFVEITASLPGVVDPAVGWGDYDNDADLDLVLAGDTGAGRLTRVYRNDGGDVFTDIEAGLPGLAYGSCRWGDLENDGDLDLLLTGYQGDDSDSLTRLYVSGGYASNTPPAAPGNLSSSLLGNQLTLNWDAATDAQTPAAGLSYNLRVGITPGGSEICSPMADMTSGYRRVVQRGNAQQRTSWTITIPDPEQPYYWSVQAVDGAYAGSAFAAEKTSFPATSTGETDVPSRTIVYGAAPNPFNPRTIISFGLAEQATVNLRVYDVSGRLVRTLIGSETLEPGRHESDWYGRNEVGRSVAAGVYFYRFDAGEYSETGRMTLVK